jgi:hypothetical protein
MCGLGTFSVRLLLVSRTEANVDNGMILACSLIRRYRHIPLLVMPLISKPYVRHTCAVGGNWLLVFSTIDTKAVVFSVMRNLKSRYQYGHIYSVFRICDGVYNSGFPLGKILYNR